MSFIKVILVDDHKIVRDGIMSFTIGHETIRIIGEAGDEFELRDLLESNTPDVIVMDISLPGKDGIALTSEILNEYPKLKILMLSASDDERTIKDSIKAGAMGFLHKDCEQNEFLSAIEKVSLNQCYFGNHLSTVYQQLFIENNGKKLMHGKNDDELTKREEEVLKHLASGLSDKEIADVLNVSETTINFHRVIYQQQDS